MAKYALMKAYFCTKPTKDGTGWTRHEFNERHLKKKGDYKHIMPPTLGFESIIKLLDSFNWRMRDSQGVRPIWLSDLQSYMYFADDENDKLCLDDAMIITQMSDLFVSGLHQFDGKGAKAPYNFTEILKEVEANKSG